MGHELPMNVLALSHEKNPRIFACKNRRIFIKKNQLVNSPVCFPTGAFKHQIHRNLPSLGPAISDLSVDMSHLS